MQSRLVPGHPQVAAHLIELGRVLMDSGELFDAARHAECALSSYRKYYGNNSRDSSRASRLLDEINRRISEAAVVSNPRNSATSLQIDVSMQ